MPDDDVAVGALVHQLAAYLRDNPLACDTQEGIARWWLEPGTAVDGPALSRALERLQRDGLIESLRAADGRVRYRRVTVPTSREGGTRLN